MCIVWLYFCETAAFFIHTDHIYAGFVALVICLCCVWHTVIYWWILFSDYWLLRYWDRFYECWLPVTSYQLLHFGIEAVIGCLYLNVHCLIILLCISSHFSHHINHVYPGFPCLDVLLCCVWHTVLSLMWLLTIGYWLFHYWDRRLWLLVSHY